MIGQLMFIMSIGLIQLNYPIQKIGWRTISSNGGFIYARARARARALLAFLRARARARARALARYSGRAFRAFSISASVKN
ncbi:hypothetical protein BLOT_005712 [Blomia tropicalis]|nr:hypothetical protein BLOT_005712 [Blomia tropicalis]